MNNDIGYFNSIQAYVQGEAQRAEDTKSKQVFFKGMRICSVAVTGAIGATLATVLCIPVAIVASITRCCNSIKISQKNYVNKQISLPKLIINTLKDITLGLVIGTISFSFTTFADIALLCIGKLNNIKYSEVKPLTTRLIDYSLPNASLPFYQQI